MKFSLDLCRHPCYSSPSSSYTFTGKKLLGPDCSMRSPSRYYHQKNNKFLCSVRWFYGYISCTPEPWVGSLAWHGLPSTARCNSDGPWAPQGPNVSSDPAHEANTDDTAHKPFFKLLIWDSHLGVLRTYSGFSFGDNSWWYSGNPTEL